MYTDTTGRKLSNSAHSKIVATGIPLTTIAEFINAVGGRTAVARKLGISYSTVNWWYTANRVPDRTQAARLADLCGVSTDTLWRRDPTAQERRQRYVEAAINDLERYAATTTDEFRRAEIKRNIAGLYSVLAHLSPKRYVGAIDVPGGADDDECGLRRIGADKVGFRVSGGGADHVSE